MSSRPSIALAYASTVAVQPDPADSSRATRARLRVRATSSRSLCQPNSRGSPTIVSGVPPPAISNRRSCSREGPSSARSELLLRVHEGTGRVVGLLDVPDRLAGRIDGLDVTGGGTTSNHGTAA